MYNCSNLMTYGAASSEQATAHLPAQSHEQRAWLAQSSRKAKTRRSSSGPEVSASITWPVPATTGLWYHAECLQSHTAHVLRSRCIGG